MQVAHLKCVPELCYYWFSPTAIVSALSLGKPVSPFGVILICNYTGSVGLHLSVSDALTLPGQTERSRWPVRLKYKHTLHVNVSQQINTAVCTYGAELSGCHKASASWPHASGSLQLHPASALVWLSKVI